MSLTPNERRQILALDEFHHEGVDVTRLFETVDRGNIGMIQRGEDFGFALKARQPIGVSRQRRRQDLDGDLALQLRVGRPIHLPHAAFADFGGDLIRAETGAGSQGHAIFWDYTEAGTRQQGLVRSAPRTSKEAPIDACPSVAFKLFFKLLSTKVQHRRVLGSLDMRLAVWHLPVEFKPATLLRGTDFTQHPLPTAFEKPDHSVKTSAPCRRRQAKLEVTRTGTAPASYGTPT